jgi:hypothetical protein
MLAALDEQEKSNGVVVVFVVDVVVVKSRSINFIFKKLSGKE